MLSMLSNDVRVHSQFSLPRSDETVAEANLELRKYFDLPNEKALAVDDVENIDAFSQADLISNNQMASLHLTDCLTPKPLAFRDDQNFVATTVLSNTSLYCQQQHGKANNNIKPRLNFNANNWLKSVQTSLVKSPLMEIN